MTAFSIIQMAFYSWNHEWVAVKISVITVHLAVPVTEHKHTLDLGARFSERRFLNARENVIFLQAE